MSTLLLTIKEAAEETRMSTGFIKKEIREGRLRAGKFGRMRRILRSDLEDWATKIAVSSTCQEESCGFCAPFQVIEKTVRVRR